ncbi:hypothetical protein RSSM_03155 [Rhodopirellula sallentina SM41]|uniref:Uncharacterized protein n=1 Tax=Rhodopirellula sallentina SM41 TaxID=1263870 RepID=M5UH43_9BACT|nr:hypothetical protein RSSM_03155 [Rhodopirellula sallentina SM41]
MQQNLSRHPLPPPPKPNCAGTLTPQSRSGLLWPWITANQFFTRLGKTTLPQIC